MRQRDDEAGAFCTALHPRLVRTLALHLGDLQLAEELAQETYVRVWEHWPAVAEMASPDGWAFRVAFNLAASRFRRAAAERRANARATRPPVAAPDDADAVAIRAAVAQLPARQRAAVTLRYLADLSVADTALVLGCAPGTVKSLSSQGVARLRATLALDDLEEVDHA